MKKSSISGVVLGLALVTALGSAVMLNSVSSAKMKLNKSKVSINIGKTYKLKIKGTKKKATWKSSKPYVASVTKKGIVKGWTAGTTKVTAKVGKKKCACKVVVKTVVAPPVAPTLTPVSIVTTPAPNSNTTTIANSVLAANISVTTNVMLDGNVLFTVRNNNTVCVNNIQINYQLKNAMGEVLRTSSFSLGVIDTGATTYNTVTVYSDLAIDTTKTIASVAVSPYSWRQPANSSISVTHTKMAVTSTDPYPGISITMVNQSLYKASVDGIVLFYDDAGQIVSAKNLYETIQPSATVFTDAPAPKGDFDYDNDGRKEYTNLHYASYSVITNSYVSIY